MMNIPMVLAEVPDAGGFTNSGTSTLLMGEEDVAMNSSVEKTTWSHHAVVAVASIMSKNDSCRMSKISDSFVLVSVLFG